jgi:glycosyltransferase involved in cell wall biosynthesis
MTRKRILIVCPYPENVAPSQRLKFEQYYGAFQNAGYEIVVSPFISEAFWNIIYKKGNVLSKAWYTLAGYGRRVGNLFQLGRFDIVYIHLWVTPFGPPFFEWLFRKFSKKIIYDIDDLVYLGNVESKAHPVVTYIKGRDKPIFLMKAADHVITCTPYLDQFVRKYNKQTTDISSTINTQLYTPKRTYMPQEKMIIGWSGSHSTSRYLHLLGEVFRALAKSYNFTLVVMGDADFKMDGVEVEALAWKEEYEVEVISRFDVGVYPLPDEEWVLGKSGLKALQYMALGIPTVATAIGANFRVIEDGVSGFLVKDKEDWIKQLSLLLDNASVRETIGGNGRKRVEQFFSVDANKANYLRVLEAL